MCVFEQYFSRLSSIGKTWRYFVLFLELFPSYMIRVVEHFKFNIIVILLYFLFCHHFHRSQILNKFDRYKYFWKRSIWILLWSKYVHRKSKIYFQFFCHSFCLWCLRLYRAWHKGWHLPSHCIVTWPSGTSEMKH